MSGPVDLVNKLAVLIVEDDRSVAYTLTQLLQETYDVTVAESAEAAQELLAQRRFDIALVDDRLPQQQGLELVAQMRADHPQTVRLMMSAWAEPKRLLKAINEGQLYGFLEKPLAPERLLTTLSQCGQMVSIIRERDDARRQIEQQNRTLEYLVGERTRQLEERNRQLEILATRDPLTGLFNRRYMENRLDHETARLKRYSTPFSLVLFDIDKFKSINDTLGHAAGDHVLVQVASVLKNNIRAVDVVGRIGGEEFLVLLPNSPLEGARITGDRLRRKVGNLSTPLIDHVERRAITVSGGVAVATAEDASWKDLLARADEALYAAKEAGRNCVRTG